jgi:hypothetical protein
VTVAALPVECCLHVALVTALVVAGRAVILVVGPLAGVLAVGTAYEQRSGGQRPGPTLPIRTPTIGQATATINGRDVDALDNLIRSLAQPACWGCPACRCRAGSSTACRWDADHRPRTR